MNRLYPNCFNFIFHIQNQDYFIGSTPERLLKIKQNNLKVDALAGTATSKENLKKHKEVEEHSYVINHIKKVCNKYCINIDISKTKILNLKYAYHLLTQINGKLKKKKHSSLEQNA